MARKSAKARKEKGGYKKKLNNKRLKNL